MSVRDRIEAFESAEANVRSQQGPSFASHRPFRRDSEHSRYPAFKDGCSNGVRPCGWAVSSCCFDRLLGVLVARLRQTLKRSLRRAAYPQRLPNLMGHTKCQRSKEKC